MRSRRITARVYQRDASAYTSPDTNGVRVCHFVDADGCAECNGKIPLDLSGGWPPRSAPLRCTRPPCARLYDYFDQLLKPTDKEPHAAH